MNINTGEIKLIIESLDREYYYYINKAERLNNSLGQFYLKKADVYKKLILKLAKVEE